MFIVYVIDWQKQTGIKNKIKKRRILWFDPRSLVKVSRRRALQLVLVRVLGPAPPPHWPDRQNGLYSTSCLSKEEAHGTRMGTTTRIKKCTTCLRGLNRGRKEPTEKQKEDVETKADTKKIKNKIKNQTDHVSSVREKTHEHETHERLNYIFFSFSFFLSAFPINCLMLEL